MRYRSCVQVLCGSRHQGFLLLILCLVDSIVLFLAAVVAATACLFLLLLVSTAAPAGTNFSSSLPLSAQLLFLDFPSSRILILGVHVVLLISAYAECFHAI